MENKALIKQDNRVISASYTLEMAERRLIFLAITKLQEKSDIVKISLEEFRNFYGFSKKTMTFRNLKRDTKFLFDRVIHYLDGRNEVYTRWVYKIIFDDKTQEVYLYLNPALFPYFLDVKKNYTSYFLDETNRFKSIYSIRLYEQLKRFKKTGFFKISVDNYRLLHDLNDKYHEYRDVKKRTIIPAIKEINEKSKYQVDFYEIKKGRKVDFLEFKFVKKINDDSEEKSFLKQNTNKMIKNKNTTELLNIATNKYEIHQIKDILTYLHTTFNSDLNKTVVFANFTGSKWEFLEEKTLIIHLNVNEFFIKNLINDKNIVDKLKYSIQNILNKNYDIKLVKLDESQTDITDFIDF